MSLTIKTVAPLVAAIGLGVALVGMTPTPASATCHYEKTDYQGPGTGTPENCLGGSCTSGWCCRICTS